VRLLRSIRPSNDVTPNPNDPASVPPSTVGPDQLVEPGDPHGLEITGGPGAFVPPSRVLPSPWSGWPAEWMPPTWSNTSTALTDTAWTCLDLNASVLSSMPPYLVGAADSLDAGWMTNPDPDQYTSWEEFAKRLFWDYQLGEAFIIATAWYATGWPARFHVLPPWAVSVELEDGLRRYEVGSRDVTGDVLHLRYTSAVGMAHGQGPLEVGWSRLVSDQVLTRYAQQFAASGGVPTSVLTHPEDLTAKQAADLQAQWVTARTSQLGEPAVLSGGVDVKAMQVSPKDAALVELQQYAASRIAVLLKVPPFLVGLPSGGDSMTYSNVTALFDYHWRAGLRPMAQAAMAALSGWLLPRGTGVELNRDAYVQPEPLQRAQVAQIYANIKDPQGNPVLTVDEIRAIERMRVTGAAGVGLAAIGGGE
jgi:HK97 family phage portal protein